MKYEKVKEKACDYKDVEFSIEVRGDSSYEFFSVCTRGDVTDRTGYCVSFCGPLVQGFTEFSLVPRAGVYSSPKLRQLLHDRISIYIYERNEWRKEKYIQNFMQDLPSSFLQLLISIVH